MMSDFDGECTHCGQALGVTKRVMELENRLAAARRQLRQFDQNLNCPACRAMRAAVSPRPIKVCLCGSTRFYQQFQEADYRETMAGKIVLSVGVYHHVHGQAIGITADQKAALDELHKRKIDEADEVLVINVGGYIGTSTHSEIEYAQARGKPIRWWEPQKGDL